MIGSCVPTAKRGRVGGIIPSYFENSNRIPLATGKACELKAADFPGEDRRHSRFVRQSDGSLGRSRTDAEANRRARTGVTMPTFVSVLFGGGPQNRCEIPIAPDTLCGDVLHLCQEPGEHRCCITETWRGDCRSTHTQIFFKDKLIFGTLTADGKMPLGHSERVIKEEEEEKRMEVLQRWGQRRGEVSYLLRRLPRTGARVAAADRAASRGHATAEEDEVARPDRAISRTPLPPPPPPPSSQERRPRHSGLEDRRKASAAEEECVRHLWDGVVEREAKLRRLRAVRGQVELKRVTNGELASEVERMSALFRKKREELLVGVARVEQLSERLEEGGGGGDGSSSAELERLRGELQLRIRLNHEQDSRLRQQRDALSRKNREVASAERRVADLRGRLWKKKAGPRHKENTPVPSDGTAAAASRQAAAKVAAVAPYVRSACRGPPPSPRQRIPAPALPARQSPPKPPPRHFPPGPVEGEAVGQATGHKSILRTLASVPADRGLRVKFKPLADLLDAALEGDDDLVRTVIDQVDDPSGSNDDDGGGGGATALHNAVRAGHADIARFLVRSGVDVNTADGDGWTPLHRAASCNDVELCKFLVESGAAVLAVTPGDTQMAADKCEEMDDGYAPSSYFLYGLQERLGIMNRGLVYGLWDYKAQSRDELSMRTGDRLTVLRRDEDADGDWWLARCGHRRGFVPRNLLGLYPRIRPQHQSPA